LKDSIDPEKQDEPSHTVPVRLKVIRPHSVLRHKTAKDTESGRQNDENRSRPQRYEEFMSAAECCL
jgi:hypothetical protein